MAYNCFAWALSDDSVWIEPPDFADPGSETEFAEKFNEWIVNRFREGGFEPITPATSGGDGEWIVLYAVDGLYTHAARRLAGGKWTSKLGDWEDIEHDFPDSLEGPLYGAATTMLRRQRS